MFTIGDFARHGRVSVRMLRHYDATGLLHPARVDPATGYRYYTAAQLARLNRIIALKDLGFTLQQVREILDEKVTTEELRTMLRVRRADLEAAMTAAAARLVQVEARLRSIESEGQMSVQRRRAEEPAGRARRRTDRRGDRIRRGHRTGHPAAVRANCSRAWRRRASRRPGPVSPTTRTLRTAVSSSTPGSRSRPRCRRTTACGSWICRRSSRRRRSSTGVRWTTVLPTIQTLARWIEANGYRSAGYPREINLECPENRDEWVTELQEPITAG